MRFYLKNKDIILAEISYNGITFTIDTINNSIYNICNIRFLHSNDLFNYWINKRKSPFSRKNMHELYKECSIRSILDFVTVTKCLSLNDTFWVCSVKDKLSWNDVSLYRNSFSKALTNIAWGSYGLDGRVIEKESPEFSTNGVSTKCWQRVDNNICLLKTKGGIGELEYSNVYSEYLASQLASFLDLNHVDYTLRKKNGMLASCCKLFTSEDIGFVSMCDLFGDSNCGSVDLDISCFSMLGCRDKVINDYRSMLVFDSLIHNVDRHNDNYGLLFSTSTFDIIGLAPIFDNDNSLFNYLPLCGRTKDYIKENVNILYPKTFNGTFVQQAKYCLDESLYMKVSSVVDSFEFKNSKTYPLVPERLDILSSLVRIKSRSIID